MSEHRRFPVFLTEGQATALLQFIDVGCRSQGLPVARAAIELEDLIRAAAKAELEANPALKAPQEG